MKESVKIDADIVEGVRKKIKKTRQTIGGYFEMVTLKSLAKVSFDVGDNSDAFLAYLDSRGVRYKPNGSFTTVWYDNPFSLGEDWGIYQYQHSPLFKNVREHFNDIANGRD